MLTYPKTPAQFKRQAEKGIRTANPEAEVIEWTFGPKRVTFPTGLEGFSGVFTVEGYRGSHVATATRETGLSIR